MGQQSCIGVSLTDSVADSDCNSEGGPGTAHAQEVRKKVLSLAEKYGWRTDPEVEDALARTDLPSYRRILKKHRTAEPKWDEAVHGAFSNDSRVQRLAAGGFVFEDLCVYTVLVQLIYPALVREGTRPPRVLDVGCGTGFLTAVLARLVGPRGGSVIAIDMFARQVEHAQRTMTTCCPELLQHVTFVVANGLEYQDPCGAPFDAIAVACQASEVPQALVRQLAPGGYLVAPVGRPVPKDKGKAGPYHKYWLVKKGPDGSVVFSGRAGPIGVNFVPLLPPSKSKDGPATMGLPSSPPSSPPAAPMPVVSAVATTAATAPVAPSAPSASPALAAPTSTVTPRGHPVQAAIGSAPTIAANGVVHGMPVPAAMSGTTSMGSLGRRLTLTALPSSVRLSPAATVPLLASLPPGALTMPSHGSGGQVVIRSMPPTSSNGSPLAVMPLQASQALALQAPATAVAAAQPAAAPTDAVATVVTTAASPGGGAKTQPQGAVYVGQSFLSTGAQVYRTVAPA
mmetsp:Transcript_36065/g.90687  ORF Transcript_36065/g.90687 Transcript_36065/m.90687 type:complete len:511 (+) Transcript_36065:126-1658(+)